MSSSGLCVSCEEPLILPDANFCAKCGSPQSRPQQDRLCVHCKFQLPPNAMFCINCGTLQPRSQQQGTQKSTTPQKPKEEIDNDKKKPSHPIPNLPKHLLPVLHVPREEAVKIQFNAVIHLKIWKWEEGKSSIYMRFGHKELGGWKRDIGPCILHRDAGNGFYIVRHELYVGYEFLKANWNNLLYKYVVYSPRSNDIGHQFEFLHAGTPTFDYNRLLRVPQYQLKPGGCYQQFDTMILPQLKTTTTKSAVGKWWDSADASKLSTITLPSPDILCSQCMELYLQATRDLLINGTFSVNFSIQGIVEECMRLFECFCVQWLEHKGKEEKWIVALDPSIKKWFESVLDVLLTSELESHLRIVSGVLIAWCLKNLIKSHNIDITDDMKTGLLQVMSLTVANGEKELEFLQSILKTSEKKKNVLDVLLYYWRAVIDLGKDIHILTVIKALPLYHFLSGMSLPNQSLHIALKEAHWKDSAFNFTQLKELIGNNPNFVKTYHDTLMQLFQFDLQFLALIPYFYPQNDTSVVCGILPVELAIIWLIARLQLSNCRLSVSSISVNKMEQDLMNPMACILQRLFSMEIIKFTFLSRCLEAAIYFMESFKESLNNSRNTEIFVTSMVSLFLHILHRAKSFNDKTNDQENYCQILKDKTRELLKNWVICANVVDREAEPLEAKLEKLEQELKFLKTILSIPLPADEMKNELEAIVLDLVNDRVSEIPTAQLKIEAFVSVKTWKGIPDSLRNVFLTKAMEAVGTILSQEATESCSDCVMKFISKIIEESAPSHAPSSNTSLAMPSPERGTSPTPFYAIEKRGTSTPSSTAILASLAMLSPQSSGKSCTLMSRWHLLNTIDQTEHFIIADDSTPSLQKDNKTFDINPLQGLAIVHSQGIDGNISLPEEGGKKNKEENKESKRKGENKDSEKRESGSGRNEKGIKTNGSGEYGKDGTGERNNVKSQVKPHNPQTDSRDTPISLLFPNLPANPFDVLNSSKDKTIKIQFNAVIQKSIWEWEEERSTVYMRFGHKELGNWKYDIGPCILLRDAGHGFHAVRYDMTVNSEFMVSLKIGLSYKYVVYSPKANKIGHQFEYLHGAPPYNNPNNNRLLKVPKEKLGPGGYYRQFDTMILPDVKVKVPKRRLKVWDFFSGAEPDDSDAITVPTPALMRSQCMEIYLQPARDILLTGNFKIGLEGAINGCVSLIQCAFLQWVEHRGEQYSWEVTSISPFLIEWVQSFLVDINKCRDTVPHAVTSSVLLACCLYKLRRFYNIPISDELKISLLQAISLSVTNGEKELNFLGSMMQKSSEAKNSVITAFVYYLRSVIELENSDNAIIVVKALPLYHFLCNLSAPYQQSHVPLNKIAWGDDSLFMQKLQMTLRYKKGFVQKYEKDIQQLLQFDSQLLYIIPYICPEEDTSAFCDILPLDLAIVWLIERLNLHGRYSLRLSGISENKMENCFMTPLAGIMQRLNERGVANFDVLFRCSDAAVCFLASFKERLDGSKNAKILVKSTISLFLHILHRANIFNGKTNDQESLCQILRVNVHDLLKDWVVRGDIVGGSFFGAGVKFAGTVYQELRKEYEELEFWETILAIKLPVDDMKKELEAIVLDLVSNRVSNIPSPELKIDLFIHVEKRKGIPDSFRNIFFMKAIEALDDMFSKRSPAQSIQRWDALLELISERVFQVISKIIEKKYPDFRRTHEVPFNDLLEWEMWPGVLKVYYNYVVGKKDTRQSHDDWRVITAFAASKLESVCNNIHNGTITITELMSIKAKQAQMNKLCEAISKSQLAELQRSMKQRLTEFEHFEIYKMKLEHFLSHIGKALIGQSDLMRSLQKDFKKERINTLCQTASDGSCNVVCFPNARPLDPCLDGFYIISHDFSSDIFNRIWQERLNEQSAAIASSNVDAFIWKPVFKSCTALLVKLKSKDMTLLEIDNRFKHVYLNKLDSLEQDLINFQCGVNSVEHSTTDITWVKKIVETIGQYWDLCGYREAAEAFLKICYTLKLTGDFALVERVATKVSSDDKTLNSIDHSVVEAGRFLQEYATDPTKRECLEAFAECQKIVEWIRKETQDVTNLVNFVAVALATAAGGEGDMITHKLSFLRTVGSGFGPLIYRLPQDASYQTLQERCKNLWVTLATAPNLPGMMRTCEREIDWYKSFKKKYDLRFR